MAYIAPYIKAAVTWIVKSQTWRAIVVRAILVNVALSAVSKALAPSGNRGLGGNAPGTNVTSSSTVEARRIVFGRRRCAGVIAFKGLSNSASSTTNDLLHYIVVLTGHEVAGIDDVWLDNVRIGTADINTTTDPGMVIAGQFAGAVRIFKYLGTATQSVDTSMALAFPEWPGDHQLIGCAYIHVICTKNDNAFPQGAPQNISAIVRGAKVYDPRLSIPNGGTQVATNPSTWAYSTNPALILRWYLTGGSVYNNTTGLKRYGLQIADSQIDDAYVIAAANHCEEALTGANAPPPGAMWRYQCHAEFSCDQNRREIIGQILASMAGKVVVVQDKYRVFAGVYDTPSVSLNENDIYGADFQVNDTTPLAQRVNKVSATYNDASQEFIQQSTIFRTDASAVTRDAGRNLPREINLASVTDVYQAQRLAEIELRRSWMQRTIVITGGVDLLKLALNDTFMFSHTRFGWTNRVFRVQQRQFNFDKNQVVLTCQREDSGVYTDLLTADYTTGTTTTATYQEDGPDTITGFTCVPGVGHLEFSWDVPARVSPGDFFELWEHTSSTPFSSATRIWRGTDTRVTIQRNTTVAKYYWVRAINRNGQYSATTPATTGLSGAVRTSLGWTPGYTAASGATMAAYPDGTLEKLGGVNAWDSQFYSIERYLNGAQVTFVTLSTNKALMVGLNSDTTTDASYSSLDYAFYLTGTSAGVEIYESGVGRGQVATSYTTSSVFSIRYDGKVVRYYIDGAVVRAVPTAGRTFGLDSSFNSPGASVKIIDYSANTGIQVASGNLLNVQQWVPGTSGTQGTFVNFYDGTNNESSIITGTGPLGQTELLWKCQSIDHSGSNADGGFYNFEDLKGIDPTKTYRFTAWFKCTSALSGTVYFGCDTSYTLDLNGVANANPYFTGINTANTTVNKWYLLVGLIHGSGYSGSSLGVTGVYDPATGTKATGVAAWETEFKMAPDAPQQTIRAYYWASSSASAVVQFARPRVDIVDGNEPSLLSLLGLAGTGLIATDAATETYQYTAAGPTAITSDSTVGTAPVTLLTTTYAPTFDCIAIFRTQVRIDNTASTFETTHIVAKVQMSTSPFTADTKVVYCDWGMDTTPLDTCYLALQKGKTYNITVTNQFDNFPQTLNGDVSTASDLVATLEIIKR